MEGAGLVGDGWGRWSRVVWAVVREGGRGETVTKREGREVNEGRLGVVGNKLCAVDRRWVCAVWESVNCVGGAVGGSYGAGYWRCARGVRAVRSSASRRSVRCPVEYRGVEEVVVRRWWRRRRAG